MTINDNEFTWNSLAFYQSLHRKSFCENKSVFLTVRFPATFEEFFLKKLFDQLYLKSLNDSDLVPKSGKSPTPKEI